MTFFISDLVNDSSVEEDRDMRPHHEDEYTTCFDRSSENGGTDFCIQTHECD